MVTHTSWYETFIRLGSKGLNRVNYEHRYTRKTEVAQNDEGGCNHMRTEAFIHRKSESSAPRVAGEECCGMV